MQHERSAPRRKHGSGSLIEREGVYYGQWRVDGRIVKRKLGRKRVRGTTEGLTKAGAEARLRQVMQEVTSARPVERMTVEEVGTRYIQELRLMGRKPSTIKDYEIVLARHLVEHFGTKVIDRVGVDDVRALLRRKLRENLSLSTIHHVLNLLNGILKYAVENRWAKVNPVPSVKRPPAPGPNPDIRFLDPEEVEALLRAVPEDRLGAMESVLYLAAATTGLRQGELVALRWLDVDWLAGVVRVRRTYSRGEWGTPKSRRSSRAVPMVDRLAAEIERHYKRSAYQDDEALVFGHPDTGRPYDASKLRKRFDAAITRAGVRQVTFHCLRHSYATRMAAVGTPLRSLQEYLGHRDSRTTAIYADYQPNLAEAAAFAARAFEAGHQAGHQSEQTEATSPDLTPLGNAGSAS